MLQAFLLKIAVEGGEVDVGRTIAVIGEEGEEVLGRGERGGGARGAGAAGTPARTRPRPTCPRKQSPEHVRSSDGGRIKAVAAGAPDRP
jgi:pyruvate/2-oxoglutarate dehydrogenase complex dihydrolipoamide acyltransferase (E2) component